MNKLTRTKTGLWQVRITDEYGARKKKSFPSYDDALFAANTEKSRVGEVKRGMRSPTPPDRLFTDLSDYWRANRIPQKRSGKHDESILNAHLLPAFGETKLRDIDAAAVDKFIVERIDLDKKTVANHLVLLGSMLKLAHELGWLLKAPKIRKPKIRMLGKDYRYLRTDEEVTRFLRTSHDEGFLVYATYAIAVFSGMREGEVAGLMWSKVDFDRRLITVDRSYEGPTKAEDTRYVPILDPLLPILRQLRLSCPGDVVVPNERGGIQGKSGRIFQEILHRVLDAAGFPKTERKSRSATKVSYRRYIVFHDLRHTFASHWVMKGGDLFKLQKILGHKTVQMTMRYAHLVPEVYAADHARFGDIAAGKSVVVVPLRTGRFKKANPTESPILRRIVGE